MKTHLRLVWAAMVAMTLSACSERISFEQANDEDRINEYTKAWIQTIGLIPANQDWCMVDAVTANISTDGLEDGSSTRIYTANPADGGRLMAVATGNRRVVLDVSEGTTELYAKMFGPDGNVVTEGMCEIANGATSITPTSLAPARQSRYAHTPSNFTAMIICEDLGSIGDFDFNDVVLGLNTVTVEDDKYIKIVPMAAGGILSANILFGDDKEDQGEIHELMSDNSVAGSGKFYNTSSFDKNGSVIDIKVASTWTIANKWKDIKIRVQSDTNTAYEISVAPAGGAPQMICIGGDFFWPKEGISIKAAYPGFEAWATGEDRYQSGDPWVDNKVDAKVVPWDIDQLDTSATSTEPEPEPEPVYNYFIGTTSDGSMYHYSINYVNTMVNSGEECIIDIPTSCEYLFAENNKLETLDVNGSHFDTSEVESFNNMFSECSKLTTLDIANLSTINVEDMSGMFNYCENLTYVDLSSFVTTKVTNMGYMFADCEKIDNINVNNFNTSQVNNMAGMFTNCKGLTNLDVSNFDTQKVTDMNSMFYYCRGLQALNVSNFDTQKVTNMSSMFYYCSGLQALNVSNFDTRKVTDMSSMFYNCQELENLDVSNFDTSNVTNMGYMFAACGKLTSINVSNFNTSKVENMAYLFNCCYGLQALNLSNFDTSNVKTMEAMFVFLNLTDLDLSNFNTSNVTNMKNMFAGCDKLLTLNLSNFDISKVTKMNDMFLNCNNTLEITCKAAFRDWCIENKETIRLPSGLQDSSSSQWHIVD